MKGGGFGWGGGWRSCVESLMIRMAEEEEDGRTSS